MSSPPRRATKGWDGPSSRRWRSGFPLSAPRWAGSQPSWWTASAGGSCRRRTPRRSPGRSWSSGATSRSGRSSGRRRSAAPRRSRRRWPRPRCAPCTRRSCGRSGYCSEAGSRRGWPAAGAARRCWSGDREPGACEGGPTTGACGRDPGVTPLRCFNGGLRRFLDTVAEARRRNPRVLLIAGVEVVPHYYWTGSPLALEMTAHNTQKNLLVFGLAREALEALPVTGNMAAGGFAWTVALDLVPGLLLIPGALLLVAKRRAVQRVGHAVVLVRRRRWLPGGFLCAVGALALARAWPFTVDPYPPYSDLGLAPHQALIDYIDRLGGVTVWSLPEARDSGEQWLGPIRVAWQTDPYPDDLLRTFRYTAFGAVYEDTTRFDLGGGGWDQLLRQYAAGERSRPAWAG